MRVFRPCPLVTPKDARSSLQMLAIARAMAVLVRLDRPPLGAPLGQRFMVWNFVSSRKERIVQAQDDWEAQRFERVPGETEFIPLPPRRP